MAEKGTCFSSAVIWRCSALRQLENQLLIIGPAIQLLFCLLLIVVNRRSKHRYHLFLSAEGIVNFIFSLLELLFRLVAAAQRFQTFTIIDITLAAASFLPLLLYSTFVFCLIRSQIVTSLPKRFQNITKILFILFIPAVTALGEISSFIGVERSLIRLNPGSDEGVIAIGFPTSSTGTTTWPFFTSFALAILTVLQAMAFTLVFYRLIIVTVNQRRIEQTGSDEGVLYKGIGWTALGLKLGAIETVVGFVSPSFGTQLTRRMLRAISRGFLVMGMIKGAATVEDFTRLQEEMTQKDKRPFRRSRLLGAIGNPRHSTFQHMSPTARAFHDGSKASIGPSPLGMGVTRHPASPGQSRERVTVLYEQGAPTLEMRFSHLDMPDPAIIVQQVKSRPNSIFAEDVASIKRARSLRSIQSEPDRDATSDPFVDYAAPPVPLPGRDMSHHTMTSMADSVNTIRELAGQFPGLPSGPASRQTHYRDLSDDSRVGLSPSGTVMPPTHSRSSSGVLPVPHNTRGAPVPSPVDEGSEVGTVRWPDVAHDSPSVISPDKYEASMSAVGRPHGRHVSDDSNIYTADSSLSQFTSSVSNSRPTSYSIDSATATRSHSPAHRREMSDQSRHSHIHTAAWLHRKPIDAHMDDLAQSVMAEQRGSWVSAQSQSSPEIIPRHSPTHRALKRTPTFTKTGQVRGSVHLHIQPPPPAAWQNHGMIEVVQTESPSYDGDKLLRNVLRDEEAIEINR